MTTINVTQECINNGEREECSRCPVAIAILPHLKVGYHANAVQTFIRIVSNKQNTDYCKIELPYDSPVRSFINNFDAGETVHPFSFDLDIPERFLRKESA